jgi:phage shock protein PspC (stress-responsive transcriptional regulator)
MNKVVTINLGGNAYQLEEKAYDKLQKYLASARTKLADDPDKDEILADFERTIAEKCDGYLKARKTVVTEAEIEKIIKQMGPVEPAKSENAEDESKEPESQPKRLYTLKEGGIIGGVCNGLAAYFNIDVTVVRLIFVLLVFVSAGFWLLVYVLAMLLLPEAQTPEQKAELRGEKFSAQDVLKRAKKKYADVKGQEHWKQVADQTKPMLSRGGQVILNIFKIVALAVTIALSTAVGLLTAVWVGSLWWLIFAHPHFTDQLSTISLWTIGLGFTALYLLMMLPVLLIAHTTNLLRKSGHVSPQDGRWFGIGGVLWVIAAAILLGVVFTVSGRVHEFQQSHGYVNIDGHHNLCVNNDLCNDPSMLPTQRYYHYENGRLYELR